MKATKRTHENDDDNSGPDGGDFFSLDLDNAVVQCNMASARKSKAKTRKRESEYPNEQVSKDEAETDLTNHSALIRTADQATLFSISSLIIQGPFFVARRLFSLLMNGGKFYIPAVKKRSREKGRENEKQPDPFYSWQIVAPLGPTQKSC